MRLDLLSRRGPGGRSTSASALRPAAAAAISVGVRGGTAPRQPRSGTRGVWPQRVCWLGYENASGDSCGRAPTVASSAFSRSATKTHPETAAEGHQPWLRAPSLARLRKRIRRQLRKGTNRGFERLLSPACARRGERTTKTLGEAPPRRSAYPRRGYSPAFKTVDKRWGVPGGQGRGVSFHLAPNPYRALGEGGRSQPRPLGPSGNARSGDRTSRRCDTFG